MRECSIHQWTASASIMYLLFIAWISLSSFPSTAYFFSTIHRFFYARTCVIFSGLQRTRMHCCTSRWGFLHMHDFLPQLPSPPRSTTSLPSTPLFIVDTDPSRCPNYTVPSFCSFQAYSTSSPDILPIALVLSYISPIAT